MVDILVILAAVVLAFGLGVGFAFWRYRERMHRETAHREWAVEKLREGEELLRTIVDSTKEAMISIGDNGLIILFNPAAEKMFGRKKREMLRQPLDCLMPEEYRKQHQQHVISYFATGKPDGAIGETLELPGLRSDGAVFPMEVSLSPGRLGNKQFVIAVARDITERKEMEDALRQSEERFRQVAANAQEWIWEVDAEGLYTYTSPAVEKILGYKPEEIVGKEYFYELFHPDEREGLKKAAFEVFGRKEPFRGFVNLNVHKDGSLVWLSTSGVPVLDEEGRLLGYRGADTDVTESRRVEDALRESLREHRSG
jgi:PAS domain S-box-containing protein